MAEIHVQAKKKTGPIWFWIVLFLVILAGIVAYVMFRDDKQDQKNIQNQSFLLPSNQRSTTYMM